MFGLSPTWDGEAGEQYCWRDGQYRSNLLRLIADKSPVKDYRFSWPHHFGVSSWNGTRKEDRRTVGSRTDRCGGKIAVEYPLLEDSGTFGLWAHPDPAVGILDHLADYGRGRCLTVFQALDQRCGHVLGHGNQKAAGGLGIA